MNLYQSALTTADDWPTQPPHPRYARKRRQSRAENADDRKPSAGDLAQK